MQPLEKRLSHHLASFLGDPPLLKAENTARLPLFLRDRFHLRSTELWGRRVLFALEDDDWESGPPGEYEKLAAALRTQLGEPAVLVLAHLPSHARNRLIRLGLPFVIPGSQVFLPTAVMDLRERFPAPKTGQGKRLTPAAQCLVLYHLQRESLEGRPLKEVAQTIGYSPIMLTKVKDELEAADLCRSAREGRSIRLHFQERGHALWDKARPFLNSPVRKTYWLRWNKPGHPALVAGLTALSQSTSIADDRLPTYALTSEQVGASLEKGVFHGCDGPEEATVRLESWSYDPALMSTGKSVDALSLYLSLQNSLDERVQQQLAALLNKVSW